MEEGKGEEGRERIVYRWTMIGINSSTLSISPTCCSEDNTSYNSEVTGGRKVEEANTTQETKVTVGHCG